MNEREAITQLKQGDINGLETLVYLFQVPALRTAYLITQDHGLAEDAVQSAFLQVYEHIQSFDSSRPFSPWFLRIVMNNAIKTTKQRQRHISIDRWQLDVSLSFNNIETDTNMNTALEETEMRQIIRDALLELSPSQRMVIVQRYYLNLSEHEMAKELNCPPGTIKSRLHTARERLRKFIESWQTSNLSQSKARRTEDE